MTFNIDFQNPNTKNIVHIDLDVAAGLINYAISHPEPLNTELVKGVMAPDKCSLVFDTDDADDVVEEQVYLDLLVICEQLLTCRTQAELLTFVASMEPVPPDVSQFGGEF